MFKGIAGAAGKLVLVVAGAGFGLIEALRATATGTDSDPWLQDAQRKLTELQLALEHLADKSAGLEGRLSAAATKENLSESVERGVSRLEREIAVRFDQQSRSVEALRMMVAQTDELLQRVLDGLEHQAPHAESTSNEAERSYENS